MSPFSSVTIKSLKFFLNIYDIYVIYSKPLSFKNRFYCMDRVLIFKSVSTKKLTNKFLLFISFSYFTTIKRKKSKNIIWAR